MKKLIYISIFAILSFFCNVANAQEVPPAGTPYLSMTVVPGSTIWFDLQTIGTDMVWVELGDATYTIFSNTSANWIGDKSIVPMSAEVRFYGDLYKFYSVNNGANITACDPTQMADLMWLELEGNMIASIDVSRNRMLKKLYVEANSIEKLDARNLPNLERLYCRSNDMTSLLVDGCSNLELVYCEGNLLEACALDSLYMGLSETSSGKQLFLETIYVQGNPGQTTSNTTIATEKGWGVYKWVGSGDFDPIVGDGSGCEYNAITDMDKTSVSLYPNPVCDELNIVGKNIRAVEIRDASGRVVMTRNNMDVNAMTVHADKYDSGIYFVNVSSESGNETYKIVIK
ncbi:MAG: T9SS type A sorting domain-containing protein [Bacteroidales bacterium]|nr:T9SS type A sorting domain-containing protein [Bacteroidales bacterium]